MHEKQGKVISETLSIYARINFDDGLPKSQVLPLGIYFNCIVFMVIFFD